MNRLIAFALITILSFSNCSSVKNLLTAGDAEQAIREALSIGSNFGGGLLGEKGSISKESITASLFPPELKNVLSALQTLGLSNQINRFTTTLSSATESTAEKSVPIFLQGIKRMNIRDAVRIVKNGGTAATDYLRVTIGDTLRNSIAPVMGSALDEYKIKNEWNNIAAPAKLLVGDKLNLNIENLMAALVTNLMFAKIAEKEIEIRTKAEARTSSLLQKVFAKQWGNVTQ
jgi:hypothetical protein